MKSDRRDFIRLAALTGAGIAIGLTSCRNRYAPVAVSAGDRINVGLVGCGERGFQQVWQAVRHEYHMVAICDVIDERMDAAGEQMSTGVKKYRDYRELVVDPEVDLVIVATPLKWHFQISKAAILAGKHVVNEKLMVYTIEEAIELEQLAAAHDQIFKVSFEVRNNPAYGIARELVRNNILGEIVHANCTWNSRNNWKRIVKKPDKIIEFPTGEKISRERLLNWRMGMEFSGGLMGESLSHQLDAAEWILDSGHVKRATGFGNIAFWKDGRTSFDNVHATLEYDRGLIVNYNAILSNGLEHYNISIYGRNATIRLGFSDGMLIPETDSDTSLKEQVDAITGASTKFIKTALGRKLKESEDNPEREYYSQLVSGYVLETLIGYKDLAAAIKTGGEPSVSSLTGKHSSIAVHLANRAMHKGGVHSWKSEYGV